MAAYRVSRLVAEDLFGAAIEVHDPLRTVDGDDRVGRNSQNPGELCLGCSQRVLDALPGAQTSLDDKLSKQHQRENDADYDERDRQNQVSTRSPRRRASCT